MQIGPSQLIRFRQPHLKTWIAIRIALCESFKTCPDPGKLFLSEGESEWEAPRGGVMNELTCCLGMKGLVEMRAL